MISDLSYSQQTLKVEFEINNSTVDLTNDHPAPNLTNKKKSFIDKSKCLSLMMLLTFILFLVEITVGNLSGSNSLVADSFHMLSDLISFVIAMVAIKLGKRKQSANNTFGWKRAEVLGGLVNSVFLLALCFSIIIEALNRFFEQEPLKHVDYVLIAGVLGLLVNIIGLILFGIMGKLILQLLSIYKTKPLFVIF
jgi:cation diffusion facilitator family transporter